MKLLSIFALSAVVFAQTKIDLPSQSKNMDFSTFSFTRPFAMGSTLPASCYVGYVFWNTSASPGSNIYLCTSNNTWTQVSGSSTTGLTSVGFTAPTNTFSVGNSPLTANGNINLSLISQTANTFFAAPSGTSGTPIWRALTSADINFILPITSGGTGLSSVTGLTTSTPSTLSLSGSWPNQIISYIGSSGGSLPNTTNLIAGNGSGGGTDSGIAATNVVTLTGTQTLYNKSISGSQINSGTVLATYLPSATTSALGLVQPDGTTISIVSGKLTVLTTSSNAIQIQGITVSSTPPTTGQTLVYNGSIYAPTTLSTIQSGLGVCVVGTPTGQTNICETQRAVSATTDATLTTDCGNDIIYATASTTVQVSQPNTGGSWISGCPINFYNQSSGTVTLNTSSTGFYIVDQSGNHNSIVVASGNVYHIRSNGTNWNGYVSQTSTSSGGVSSFNSRTGVVTLTAADVDSVGTITNSTSGNAATASALAATPTLCTVTGQVPTGVLANGNATGCFTPSGGSGTVNSGTGGQIAYYASSGTAVSGENTVTVNQLPSTLSLPPYFQAGGGLFIASDFMYQATLPSFSGYSTLSGTLTTAASTNGDYNAYSLYTAAFYQQTAALTTSIEAVFSIGETPSVGVGTTYGGIYACDSTNNKIWQLVINIQSGQPPAAELQSSTVTSCTTANTPGGPSVAFGNVYSGLIPHLKLAWLSGTLYAYQSLNGGITNKLIGSESVGTIASSGIVANSSELQIYSLKVQ